VARPDILVAMNLPSLDRYEQAVKPGGMIFYDSSLIERPLTRTDVKAFAVPATRLAGESGFPTLGNMILVGKILAAIGEFDEAGVDAALAKVISAKRADMLDINRKALMLGANY
jgi:2-oxoglutarate ferredoxin oxidoreductase subunit gamma